MARQEMQQEFHARVANDRGDREAHREEGSVFATQTPIREVTKDAGGLLESGARDDRRRE